jgi:hypothetical protein
VVHISDSYNADTIVEKSGGGSTAALIGGSTYTAIGYPLGDSNKWTTDNYFEIKDCFNYGDNLSVRQDALGNVIGPGSRFIFIVAGSWANPYPLDVFMARLHNVYWKSGCGEALFPAPANYILPDYSGNQLIKELVLNHFKEKSVAEFRSTSLADALNKERTGTDAPWEYVQASKTARRGRTPPQLSIGESRMHTLRMFAFVSWVRKLHFFLVAYAIGSLSA